MAAKKPVGLGNKYLEIVVDKDGKTTVEVHGITDGSCAGLTAGLEEALGSVAKRTKKGGGCDVQQTVRRG